MGRVLPILFNTDMVRAILDGRKTVTRRVISHVKTKDVLNSPLRKNNPDIPDKKFISCLVDSPYEEGDILYVRETYCPNYFDREIMRIGGMPGNGNAYKADYHKEAIGDIVPEPKWTPSIHMPKEAARIWLKVTDVRVERLQDITPEQSVKEGVDDPYFYISDGEYWEKTGRCNLPCDIAAFSVLWDSTIRKTDLDRYGWDANPWIWAIDFERYEKPEEII